MTTSAQRASVDPLGWMRCDDGQAHYLTAPNQGACGETHIPSSLSTTQRAGTACKRWVVENRPKGRDVCCMCGSPLHVRGPVGGLVVKRSVARDAGLALAEAAVTCCGVVQ